MPPARHHPDDLPVLWLSGLPLTVDRAMFTDNVYSAMPLINVTAVASVNTASNHVTVAAQGHQRDYGRGPQSLGDLLE